MPFLGQWFCCGSSLTFSLRSFAGFADTSPHHFLSFASPRPGPESGRPMRQCEVPALRVSAVSQPPVGQYPSRVDQILFYSACRFLWVLPGAERLVLKWKRRVVSVGMARYGSSVPRDESDDHQIWSQMGLDQFDPYCTYYLTYCTIHNIYIDCTWWSQNLAGCWYPGHGCNGTSWCRTTPHSKENSSASTRGIRGNSPGRGLQIKYGEFWSLQKYRPWIWQELVIGCNRVYNSLGFQVVEPLVAAKKLFGCTHFWTLSNNQTANQNCWNMLFSWGIGTDFCGVLLARRVLSVASWQFAARHLGLSENRVPQNAMV